MNWHRGKWGTLCGLAVGALMSGACVGTRPALGQTVPAGEITTQETQPTFRILVQRNLVVVRVVVRDSKGRPVGGLRKEDFRLFDSGKEQVITQFAAETPSSPPPRALQSTAREPDEEATPETDLAAVAQRNYQALYIDDVQMEFEDIARVRDAADRYLATALQPDDRIGIFTSSGQGVVDFTDDRNKLRQVLSQLRQRPMIPTETRACPEISDYQAYLIVERRDPQAIAVADDEAFQCNCQNLPDQASQQACQTQASSQAEATAMQILNLFEMRTMAALRGLENLVRRMAALPGSHNIIFICPGFLSYTVENKIDEITDRALRANVIINTFDPKGLFTIIPSGDASHATLFSTLTGQKQHLIIDGIYHSKEVLSWLAADTGGEFFHNSNDMDAGFRLVGTLSEAYYILAFSPKNLKHDGRFHALKVTLVQRPRLTVQARRGYFAPKAARDPAAQAKEEIEQALFSQDEMNELPIDLHTQFFKVDDTNARLSIFTHLDLHLVRFRKEEGRNLNQVVFVTALFDRDGNYVAAKEKRLEFRLFEASLEKVTQSGITSKTSFDLKPGTYLVREVVREAEGGQMSSTLRTVEIPY